MSKAADQDRPVIVTSLAPGRDDSVQMLATQSWAASGFRVISVNVAAEIEALKASFPAVEFVPATRSALKVAGKPVPFIADLLAVAGRAGPGRTIGVVNADIIFRKGSRVRDAIATQSAGGVIMLPRVDVPSIDQITKFEGSGAGRFSIGYDGVFIDAGVAASLPDSGFCLGMPFWDYWLPMMAILRGHPLLSIATPEALHLNHATAWNQAVYFFFHALVSDLIAECRRQAAQSADPSLGLLGDVMANLYRKIFDRGTQASDANSDAEARRATLADCFDSVQEVVVHHIKRSARPLACPPPA